MTAIQDELLSVQPPQIAEVTVRCRMCQRQARWLVSRKMHAAYCGGSSCTNLERICQNCGKLFIREVNGAGRKYCSAACKHSGYHPRLLTKGPMCAWCGTCSAETRIRTGVIWPYICKECLSPIRHVVDALKAHHVPHLQAQELTQSPDCPICGRDMLTPRPASGGRGKPRPLLVVDHDHLCCPAGSHSCGRCIRGLICRDCNCAIGLMNDDPGIAELAANYLRRATR